MTDPTLVLLLAPAALFLAAAVLCTCQRPRIGLGVLVGVTGGLQTAQVGGVHLFCFAVALWVVFGVLRERRGPALPGPGLAILACAGLLASTVLIGSLVNRPLLALQLLLLATAAAVIAVLGDEDDIRPMLRGLLVTTTVAATVGVLQYLRILPHELFLGDDRPIGIYAEPDWLGMFSAVGLVIAFYRRPGLLRTALMVVHLATLLLAAARAAWLAVVVAMVAGYLAARFVPAERRPRGGWRLILLTGVAGAVMLVFNPTLREFLLRRIEGATSSALDVSAEARQLQNAGLLRLAELEPWHGLGLSASGRVGVSGRINYTGTSDNNVISNWILGWWVDGGLLAVPLMALFVFAAFRRLTAVTGLVLTVVLVSSLFSNAMVIPIAWLALGLCLIPVRDRPPPEPVAAAELDPPRRAHTHVGAD